MYDFFLNKRCILAPIFTTDTYINSFKKKPQHKLACTQLIIMDFFNYKQNLLVLYILLYLQTNKKKESYK
jgi:hypothetical protein